jgi:hypothetical protein
MNGEKLITQTAKLGHDCAIGSGYDEFLPLTIGAMQLSNALEVVLSRV